MNLSLEQSAHQAGQMSREEIRTRLKRRAHGTVVDMILRCSGRRAQQLLIDTWNDPWTFEEFAERSAEIMNERRDTVNVNHGRGF